MLLNVKKKLFQVFKAFLKNVQDITEREILYMLAQSQG